MADYYIRYGDTAPNITATLKDGSGAVIDLTSVTEVVMNLRRGTQEVSKTMSIVAPATGGTARYQWVAGDWTGASALVTGFYDIGFALTYSDGTTLTIPTSGYLTMQITEGM